MLPKLPIATVTVCTTRILEIEEDITKGGEVERDIFCGLSTGFVQCKYWLAYLPSGPVMGGSLRVRQKMCKKG